MAGSPETDTALVERARGGAIDAYEELVRRYQDSAVRTAYIITGSADDAQDVAQEAFVKAYYALARFRPGAPFRPWLLRIVANEARNRCKSNSRRAALALRVRDTQRDGAGEPAPEELVLSSERRALLLHALNRLRADDRLVIAYRYFLDLSEMDMANALHCPRGTVKSRLSRALARLRAGLSDSVREGDGS